MLTQVTICLVTRNNQGIQLGDSIVALATNGDLQDAPVPTVRIALIPGVVPRANFEYRVHGTVVLDGAFSEVVAINKMYFDGMESDGRARFSQHIPN